MREANALTEEEEEDPRAVKQISVLGRRSITVLTSTAVWKTREREKIFVLSHVFSKS